MRSYTRILYESPWVLARDSNLDPIHIDQLSFTFVISLHIVIPLCYFLDVNELKKNREYLNFVVKVYIYI